MCGISMMNLGGMVMEKLNKLDLNLMKYVDYQNDVNVR
jgi:hypothetical protein